MLRSALSVVAVILALDGPCQTIITEACSKNNSVFEDGFGRYPDWVEVQNTGSEPVQLDQFYLSDHFDDLHKWRLPSTQLAPGAFIVLLSGDTVQGDHYFPFKLSQEGEPVFLSDLDQDLISVLEVPYLQPDHSYGTSAGELRYFDQPTPGFANLTEGYVGYAPTPVATYGPGYYSNNVVIGLGAGPGSAIHYTTDGRDPSPMDQLYTGQLEINSTTVVKAISDRPGFLPSDRFIGTYAIGQQGALPMISISTHPDSLWDWERGIYVMGPDADSLFPYWGANFWRGNHIPAHVEYFDGSGNLGLSQRIDLRIQGGSQARAKPQRPLRLTARKRYGEGSVMAYPFFPERGSLEQYKHLVLRNSSGDFCLANFRDGLWHQVALHQGLDVDVLGFDPVRLYLNGDYWGMMNLRERISTQHLAYNYGADKDLVLLMDKENTSVQGDTIHFHELKEYIYAQDLNDAAHWAYVDSLLDIKSFKDYFALEIFAGNVDWPANNIRYWKPSIAEGKWRYLLHDLDATMNVFGWIPMDINMFWEILEHRAGWTHSEVFRNLLENEEFERTFINRLADLMNTAFTEERLMHEVDLIRRNMEGEVDAHYLKWDRNIEDWHHHAGALIPEFAEVRPRHVRDHVLQTFELPNTVELEFAVYPEGAGKITLNSIEPELPFKGYYFNGNAIDLSLHALNGFVFDHWGYTSDKEQRYEQPSIREEFDQDGKVTAYFRSLDNVLLIYPNPCDDLINMAITTSKAGSTFITLCDLGGRVLYQTVQHLGVGVNALEIDMTDLATGTYLITIRNDDGILTSKVIKSLQ